MMTKRKRINFSCVLLDYITVSLIIVFMPYGIRSSCAF